MAAARSFSRLSALVQNWQKNVATKLSGALSGTKQAVGEFKPPEVNEYGETNARPGWIRVTVTAAFLGYMSMNAIPIISEGTVRHPVLLLQVKDPFFQRSGASRLVYFTLTNERKEVAVRFGAMELLLEMLEGAKDDKTRIAALKAMDSLAKCELAIKELHKLGAGAALLKHAESSTNSEILSLISNVEDKMSKRPLAGEDQVLVGTAPALTL